MNMNKDITGLFADYRREITTKKAPIGHSDTKNLLYSILAQTFFVWR